MADVKWIKIYTNMFDNRKIKQIETLPNGDAILVIWLKLLVLAGNVNDCGLVYFTKDIPYTDQMLAVEFNKPLSTIQLALNVFKQFGMIEIVNDILSISNWEKYQNIEGMERVREQNRIRKQNQREREKLLLESKSVTSRDSHAIDIDIDIKNKNKKKDISKHKHGDYGNVILTDEEYDKLKNDYQNADELITFLDEYIEMKGYKAKSHYLAIKKWVVDAVNERKKKTTVTSNDTLTTKFDL